jgi:hypothetical protein
MTASLHADMPEPREEIGQGAYYALFKVVSIADLYGDDRAIEWARSAVEDAQLLRSFAETTAERLEPPEDSPGPG